MSSCDIKGTQRFFFILADNNEGKSSSSFISSEREIEGRSHPLEADRREKGIR